MKDLEKEVLILDNLGNCNCKHTYPYRREARVLGQNRREHRDQGGRGWSDVMSQRIPGAPEARGGNGEFSSRVFGRSFVLPIP